MLSKCISTFNSEVTLKKHHFQQLNALLLNKNKKTDNYLQGSVSRHCKKLSLAAAGVGGQNKRCTASKTKIIFGQSIKFCSELL